MTQVTTGLRAVFSSARIYDAAQNWIGAERARKLLVRDHLRPLPGQRLLDIGCGTARILAHLPPSIAYVGVDLSERYIFAARREFGTRGTFECIDVGRADPAEFRDFDLALAFGLLHHLDDDEVRNMLTIARNAIADDGKLVTMDGCFDAHQSALARFTISRDRGRNVRTASAYAELARSVFPRVRVDVRSDMIRIPYTHAILECQR